MQAMANFSIPTSSHMEDEPHYGDMYNNSGASSSSTDCLEENSSTFAVIILMLCVCVVGLLGNGIVIALLGFSIKRSPFTTYILNLAVADFGVLLFTSVDIIIYRDIAMHKFLYPWDVMIMVFPTLMYTASQLLLTAISTDRCVSVLFPIWHRCHQHSHPSTTVCVLIWVLTCLQIGSILIFNSFYQSVMFSFLVGAILCLPLVTISTLILLFKVSCKLQQPQRGKLLTIVLFTLTFFLIFAFPLFAIATFSYFTSTVYDHLVRYGFLCACLNSCVNPVIYYLVGINYRGQQRQSLKVILQTAFKEEEEQREEQGPTAQTQL